MGTPAAYAKPDLSRLRTRQMHISANRTSLEMDLLEWVRDIIHVTKQPPEGGLHPEAYLMASAKDSIDVLMQAAPLTMKIGGPGSKQTVHADFHWRRHPDGRWIVDAVCFGIDADKASMQAARQRAYKQALLEKAELKNARYVNLRKIAFPVESVPLERFPQELEFGNQLIEYAIERAYENAREDAKVLENLVTPLDMAIDVVGMGVKGIGPKESPGAARLEKAAEELKGEERALYDLLAKDPVLARRLAAERNLLGQTLALETYELVVDKGLAAKGAILAVLEHEKSRGDQALEVGLNVAGLLPGGPFIKMISGMMMDIAIASDAARITRLRSRFYIYFVAGYISQLTLADTGHPTRRLDRKYFDLGVKTAPHLKSPGSIRTQISLLHYASEHYTDGGWAGLGYRPEVWHFPDQYIVKWSPELLGRSFATQVHKRRYLIE